MPRLLGNVSILFGGQKLCSKEDKGISVTPSQDSPGCVEVEFFLFEKKLKISPVCTRFFNTPSLSPLAVGST